MFFPGYHSASPSIVVRYQLELAFILSRERIIKVLIRMLEFADYCLCYIIKN